jgi:hypothetical protein
VLESLKRPTLGGMFMNLGRYLEISVFRLALEVCLLFTYVQKGTLMNLSGQKLNLVRTDSSSNTEFYSIKVQIKPPVLSKLSFFP